jgi:O-antigen ligase
LNFHLYIIALIIALSTNENRLNYNNIILTVFLLSSILTLLGAYCLWNELVTSEETWILIEGIHDSVLEQFTVAKGAFVNFVSALFLFGYKRKYLKVLLICFLILDIYIVFESTKRTPVFGSIVALVLFLYKKNKRNYMDFFRYIWIFTLLCIIVIILYFNVNMIQETLDNFWYNFSNGVQNLFGNTKVSDETGSAIARYEFRKWAYNYIESNFTFVNYLFGAGYMIMYIDNPILQAFLDMGLLGVFLYVCITVIYPARIFIKGKNILVLFIVLLCFYDLIASIHAGNLYEYNKYVPVICLAFVQTIRKK